MGKNFARRLSAVTTAALVVLLVFHISSCTHRTSFTITSHPALAAGSVIVISTDSSIVVGSAPIRPQPKYIYVGTIADPIPADAEIKVTISFNPAPK